MQPIPCSLSLEKSLLLLLLKEEGKKILRIFPRKEESIEGREREGEREVIRRWAAYASLDDGTGERAIDKSAAG